MQSLLIVFSFLLSFSFSTPNYNPVLSFNSLLFSGAAYCGPSVDTWGCNFCFQVDPNFNLTTTSYDSSTNTFAFVGSSPKLNLIVVSFRGTRPESLENWIADLDFPKSTPYSKPPGSQVHRGFYQAYLAHQKTLNKAFSLLDASLPSNYDVLITGHSLGGAMAIFSAKDIVSLTSRNFHIYTFGQPRVGNSIFAIAATTQFNGNHFRVTHDRDPVPHLPPEDFGFQHSLYEVFYPAKQNTPFSYHKICSLPEDKSCSDGIKFDLDVEDHIHYLGIKVSNCTLSS